MTRRSARSSYLRRLAREVRGYYSRGDYPPHPGPTAADAPSEPAARPLPIGRIGRARRATARVAAGVALAPVAAAEPSEGGE